MDSSSHSLVTVLNTSFIHRVQIAKTLLASHDIQSFIVDENINLTIGTSFIMGYKLKVNALDFMRAKLILQKVELSE